MSPGHLVIVVLLLAALPTAFGGDEITQLVQDGTDVAVGYDVLTPGPHNLTMTLQATGTGNEITSSSVYELTGEVLWTSNDNQTTKSDHNWTANGVTDEMVLAAEFQGYTTQPGPYGTFVVSVNHLDADLDPGSGSGDPYETATWDDAGESTTGVGMPITYNGPDLPDTFPATDTAGRTLWVKFSSPNAGAAPDGGTLFFEGGGALLAVYQRADDGQGGWQWQKVPATGIPNFEGGFDVYTEFRVHTSNQFTGSVMLTARLDHGTTALDAADEVKVVYQPLPDMELSAPNGNSIARIGFDYTMNYTLRGSGNFDSVELQITNNTNGLVFKKTGLPTALGDHSVVWDAVKWNQGGMTTNGAYANPSRGPYSAKLVGMRGGIQVESAVLSLTTHFIIEFTVRDDLPGTALPGAIAAGMELWGNGARVALWSYSTATSSWNNVHTFDQTQMQITRSADAASGSTSPNIAQVHVENTTLDSLASGTWRIEVQYARDDVGNFLDTDPSTEYIDHYKWTIRLQ